jgi:hypothetical protein
MPYHVGEKGSYGCSGYPAVKDGGGVVGCHDTKEKAQAQIYAINSSEGKVGKAKRKKGPKTNPGISPYIIGQSSGAIVSGGDALATKSAIKEGDFVMGMTTEGVAHGVVEHIMWEGGTLGTPGSEYALESMPPENPAMSVRVYEEGEDDVWEPTAYSIGMMYQDAQVVDMEDHDMNEMEMISKADSYAPNSGMKSAARRAIKWKEDGKAKGAGTPVGWGRARDIVAGRSMSLSVVKRMYSFFSRHEVDKKGKGFYSGPDFPSKGRVMWDAWGGDAGFSWSRAIVKREMDKSLFQNFGKDFTAAESLTEIFKAVTVGSMVSWNSSGGRARGKVTRIIRSGTYNVPGTSVSLNASKDDPVAVIRLYRDGEPTDTIVAHKLKTLRNT